MLTHCCFGKRVALVWIDKTLVVVLNSLLYKPRDIAYKGAPKVTGVTGTFIEFSALELEAIFNSMKGSSLYLTVYVIREVLLELGSAFLSNTMVLTYIFYIVTYIFYIVLSLLAYDGGSCCSREPWRRSKKVL